MQQHEIAIDSWREWKGQLDIRPVVLRHLSGGRSNRSLLLESGDRRMVLRLNSADSATPGNTRNNEIAIWKAASRRGIAPPLLYSDEHNNFLVSVYIDNSLPPESPHGETYTRQALDLLKRCHELDVNAPEIDYAGHIECYWQLIETKGPVSNLALLEHRKPMQSTLESLIASASPAGLCHHDPVVANFVGNQERLYLIDWEYAARGLLVMDYAALCIEWNIDKESIYAAGGIEPELLAKGEAVYRYLCDLWNEVTSVTTT